MTSTKNVLRHFWSKLPSPRKPLAFCVGRVTVLNTDISGNVLLRGLTCGKGNLKTLLPALALFAFRENATQYTRFNVPVKLFAYHGKEHCHFNCTIRLIDTRVQAKMHARLAYLPFEL